MRDTVVIAIRSDPGDARLFCLPLVLGLAVQVELALWVGPIVRRSMSASGRKSLERPIWPSFGGKSLQLSPFFHRKLKQSFNFWGRYRAGIHTTFWWAHQDSNLEPKDYESSALTIEL